MRPYSPGGTFNALAPAQKGSNPPTPNVHRLLPGLPGYLIPFAPLAFVSQRQLIPSDLFSPLAFQTISTHFTAPPEVPGPPTSLQTGRFGTTSPVEPGAFNYRRSHPPTRALSPVIPNNVRTVRLTAAAGTNLARASSRDSSTLAGLLPLDSALQPEGLRRTRGVARSGLRPALPRPARSRADRDQDQR